MQIVGHYAYVCCDAGLVVIDVDKPTEPKVTGVVGHGFLNHAKMVQVQFRYAYVVDDDGVKVLDVTDLAVPVAKAGNVIACPRCKADLLIPSPEDQPSGDRLGDPGPAAPRSARPVTPLAVDSIATIGAGRGVAAPLPPAAGDAEEKWTWEQFENNRKLYPVDKLFPYTKDELGRRKQAAVTGWSAFVGAITGALEVLLRDEHDPDVVRDRLRRATAVALRPWT